MVTEGGTTQSVLRAFALMEVIAAQPHMVTARTAAEAVGLALPTTYHLLKTLVQAGYVRKDGRTYSLSVKIAELNRALERDLRPPEAATTAMFEVAVVTGETVYVSGWHQGDATIVAVAEGQNAVRVADARVGLRGYAYARASGKVLLAYGDERDREEYLRRTLIEPRTPTTIADVHALRRQLESIRLQGYAEDREEFLLGVCCLAMPILGRNGTPNLALTVTLPASRYEAEFERNLAALSTALEKVSAVNA